MAAGTVKHLDTSKFHNVVEKFQKGITEYNSIRSEVENATANLIGTWKGDAKDQFEKNYNTLYRQLTDIADIMYELREALIDAEAAYVEADYEYGRAITGG